MQLIKKQYYRYRKAFSLVELLIAMTLISISFFPLMNLFMSSLKNVQSTALKSTAMNLAREGIERIRNKNLSLSVLELREKSYFPPLNKPAIELNNNKWRILTEFKKGSRPLETTVKVFISDNPNPIYMLQTLTEDTF